MKRWYCLFMLSMCFSTAYTMQQNYRALSHQKLAMLGILIATCIARVEAPQSDVSSAISIYSLQMFRNDPFFLDRMLQPLMATSEDSYPQAVIKILGLSLTIAAIATSCFSP
jgi:hypothetical protein